MIAWALVGSISKHTIDVLPRLYVDAHAQECGCRTATIGVGLIVFHVALSVSRISAQCAPEYKAFMAQGRSRKL